MPGAYRLQVVFWGEEKDYQGQRKQVKSWKTDAGESGSPFVANMMGFIKGFCQDLPNITSVTEK